MNIDELKAHSDKRDDIIEKKLDDINDFLHNGLTEKIIKGIGIYLDKLLANRIRWFFRIITPIIATAILGIAVKLIFF